METYPYDRVRAVRYAQRYAYGRNPAFGDFSDLGGDCTNFVSQCVYAGCCAMNETHDFGWYYRSMEDRAPAWSGVEAFYAFFTGAFRAQNGGDGPYAHEIPLDAAEVGDVIQMANDVGDFTHAVLITGAAGGEVLVSAHTYDSLNRPLSTYEYTALRVLHIEGARGTTAPVCDPAFFLE